MRVRLTLGPLQATLNKLLTYCVPSGQLSLLPSAGREMSSSYRLRGEGLVWLIGAMVCLLAAPWVQLSVSAGSGWPHNALLHHWLMPISCHFRDCKALLVTSLTHVSGAIASVQTFTFTKFGTKVVIVMYSSNRSCVSNLKLLASTVAERSRGS